MELHPCPCGAETFDWSRHWLADRDGTVVSVYEGVCDGCGGQRRFEFEMTGDEVAFPAFGGASPSQIIDPGEFFAYSQRLAAAVPGDPAAVRADLLDDTYDMALSAVAALDEVLKFVPVGADAVPPTALRSDSGRVLHAGEPDLFTTRRLRAIRAERDEIRAAYAAVCDD